MPANPKTQVLEETMKKESEFIIIRKYPKDWYQYSEQKRKQKEQEFGVASFLLNNYSPFNRLFKGADILYLEDHEGPDFLVYSNEKSSKKLGLEVTDCYLNSENKKSRNIPSTVSDLEKICEEVYKDIQKKQNADSCQNVNYIKATFTHAVMIGQYFNKKELASELKDFIINKNRRDGKYICNVEIGYSAAYPNDKLKVFIYSNMAFMVPRICDIVQQQKETGINNYDPVLQSIAKKEALLTQYKQRNKYEVHKWWLCINVPQNAYMNPTAYHLPKDFSSKYDKIFLVTRFFYGYGVHLIYESK